MRGSLPRPSTLARALLAFATCGAFGAWRAAPASADPPKPPAGKRATQPAAAAVTSTGAARNWHTAPPGRKAPVDERGRPRLVLQALNTHDRIELTARSERGGFSAEDLDRAAHVLRDSNGNEHPLDPRLLDVVYRLATHFNAPEIRIISGYRAPRGRGPTSNHGKGRAMDLVVPGASDEDVAKLAREEGFAGVGVYPVSGFVHVDVRERSYFWIDSSGPGKRSRIRGVLSDLAARSDAQALARGERSVGPFLLATDVDAATYGSAIASHVTAPVEEDEGETAP